MKRAAWTYLTLLLLGFCWWIFFEPSTSPTSANGNALLFYASFDKNVLAEQAVGDESPLANQNLKIVREGKRGGAVFLNNQSSLTYDAPGNLYAERGTITFWWKLEEPLGRTPFSILRISYAQHFTWDFTFAQLHWTGEELRLWFRDRDFAVHEIVSSASKELAAGRWYHIAFTWDELKGLRLFVDGREAGSQAGEIHLAAHLDQIGIHAEAVTPHHTQGSERQAFIDELRVYQTALSSSAILQLIQTGADRATEDSQVVTGDADLRNLHWKSRFGWEDKESIPKITTATLIRKVTILNGKDLGKFWIKGSDGKRETCWPMMGHGYQDEGKTLDLEVEDEPFNYLLVQGNFKGQIYQIQSAKKTLLLDRSTPTIEATHSRWATPTSAHQIRVERQEGVLGELSLFRIQNMSAEQTPGGKSKLPEPAQRLSYRLMESSEAAEMQGVSRNQVLTLYNLRTRLLRRYLPEDREAWVGVPPEVYKPSAKTGVGGSRPRYNHIVIPPFLQNVALDAIKLKLSVEAQKAVDEAMVNLTVRDPVYPLRDLINLNLCFAGVDPTEILLDLRDIVVPAGTALWLTFASDQAAFGAQYLDGAEVELWLTDSGHSQRGERARKEYFSDRLRWIKDSFQMLSEARPWMTSDLNTIRRQFKLVEELFSLIEDVLRVDPKEPVASAYWGWIRRHDSPPDFKQPEPPSPDIPRWAFQQQFLLKQFRQVIEWWIKNRQVETGELGGGLNDDTDLISNWPAVVLMDGPAETILHSARAVMQACYRGGMMTDGLNTRRADALHAYEEGMNTVPIVALLDYGNPQVIERLMETARHYQRLTGFNGAGHRHFRSYLFSSNDLVEEGYHAREDVYCALLWHSGLALAWYNGNPQVTRWLTEYADGLLAHWQRDRYPALAIGIRFASDAVLRRGLPNPEVVNLIWGVYRLTGDIKYLWLWEQLLTQDNLDRAQTTNGRWLEFLDIEPYRNSILEEVRKHTIWDHDLQTDEVGLLARQHAYEITGDKKLVEDYQAALIKHMTQNMYVYTEAEQFTDRIWIPHRATQRARLGGVAHFRNHIYPGHAVSWENSDGKIAVLVRKATPSYLKLIVFNFARSLLDLNLRVWDLENGSYEVVEGTDVIGNDQVDVVTTRRTLSLKRHASLPLALRPLKTTVIEIKQLWKGPSLSEFPDLAIGPEDLQYDVASDQGKLTIHNIGATKSPPVVLVVENEKKTVLLKKEIEELEAPANLQPRMITVELSGLRARGARSLILKIDPENRIEEITEENNQLRRNF